MSVLVLVRFAALAVMISLGACRSSLSPASTESPPAPCAAQAESLTSRPRYGQLMAEVGRRFELLGHAAVGHRWDLARYELDELEEALEALPEARPPQNVGDVDLRAIEHAFDETHLPELRAAIDQRGSAPFATAFDAAASTCNGCHEQAKHAFIVISTHPNAPVPVLDPLP